MSSRLRNLISAIETRVTARYSEASAVPPEYFYGDRDLPDHSAALRVVWIRRKVAWKPGVRTSQRTAPRLTREITVDAYLLGRNEASAELLLDILALACLDIGLSSVSLGDAEWGLIDEQSSREAIRQPITFDVPVDDEETTVEIEFYSKNSGDYTAGDGVMEPDDP